MKIIAGTLGRRKIKTISGLDTRPTSEKIRGAIFNALGQFFDGGSVLDLFAGSGAMALEAISRGCTDAVCSDLSKAACAVVKENCKVMGVQQQVRVIQKSYQQVLQMPWAQPFKFIFVDPPYELLVLEEIVEKIYTNGLLAENGRIVLEFSNRKYNAATVAFPHFEIVFDRKYDTTQVMMLQMIAEDMEN